VKGSAALDITLLVLPALSLGLLVTAHLVIVARLFGQSPRWRAAVALLVPPLAPFWGAQAALKLWCRLWIGAALAYAITLLIALAS